MIETGQHESRGLNKAANRMSAGSRSRFILQADEKCVVEGAKAL
jgi:hypothetical protein